MKIVIVVEGGVVQTVMCDALDHPVSVHLMDHDTCEGGEDSDDDQAVELSLEIDPAGVARLTP